MAKQGKLFIAGPYDAALIARIEAHFKAKLGEDVTLEARTDESLIGGFVAIVGEKLYDCSIRTRTEDLQHYLFTNG